jgi:paraquat-inducible protein B
LSAPDEPHDGVPAEAPPAGPAAPVPPPDLPRPAIARRAHYSLWLVWLVPLVAVIIGIGLGARSILNRGPTITIYFHNAEGIEPGKTHIKYKDVDVGIVRRVKLTKDHREVEVSAEMRGGSGCWSPTPGSGSCGRASAPPA